MQLTIKTLLGLTLLVALLANGLLNYFATRALQNELDSERYFSLPERELDLEQRILFCERAIKASQFRHAKFEKLGATEPLSEDSP